MNLNDQFNTFESFHFWFYMLFLVINMWLIFASCWVFAGFHWILLYVFHFVWLVFLCHFTKLYLKLVTNKTPIKPILDFIEIYRRDVPPMRGAINSSVLAIHFRSRFVGLNVGMYVWIARLFLVQIWSMNGDQSTTEATKWVWGIPSV